MSPEQSDVEDRVAQALAQGRSELRRKWGAMSLYHRKDAEGPFGPWKSEAFHPFVSIFSI